MVVSLNSRLESNKEEEGFGLHLPVRVSCFDFCVSVFGSRVLGIGFSGFEFRVSGSGIRVPNSRFRVPDFGSWLSVFCSRL